LYSKEETEIKKETRGKEKDKKNKTQGILYHDTIGKFSTPFMIIKRLADRQNEFF